jgi:glutamyl-tRNA reductase
VLLCLTANHQNASFELLEKLSIGSATAASALVTGSTGVAGAVVLATCNRFEAYLDLDDAADAGGDPAAAAIEAIGEASMLEADALRDSVEIITGQRAVEHLFAVSAGLESVIVGEDEISGQVRRALERAREEGTTSSRLELLFQNASHTSRDVKTQTAIGTAGRSLVRLALELAASRVADWSTQNVLVVGTGQYAGTTVAALHDRGVENITVFSPSGRGAAFALRHSLAVADSLAEAFDDADLVLTCTASDVPVLTHETVNGAFTDRYRLVIDLGLPRNVDPRVGSLSGVELLDLETVRIHAPLEELNAADDARALVGRAAAKFSALEAEHEVTPAIVAFRTHILSLLEEEIARARAQGDADGRAEAALRHLTGVLLHTPSQRARTLAREGRGEEFVAGLDALYGIRAAAQPAAAERDESATA